MPRDYLGADELSALIGVPESTLAQWRYRRKGPPYYKMEGHVRYSRAEVAAWMHRTREETRRP